MFFFPFRNVRPRSARSISYLLHLLRTDVSSACSSLTCFSFSSRSCWLRFWSMLALFDPDSAAEGCGLFCPAALIAFFFFRFRAFLAFPLPAIPLPALFFAVEGVTAALPYPLRTGSTSSALESEELDSSF
ncbi:hypothetical protein BJV82DRAFT_94007 [Fennellomyces sp. T-0311]|nr:hypothetical protein BJV82DRAFT_94007 [Fennellomyces sp. T-0311]